MKYLRVTATPDPELVPRAYEIVSERGPVTELRVLDWNLAASGAGTVLYAVEGSATDFRAAALETEGVDGVALTDEDADPSYALLEARSAAMPFFETMVAAVARAGMIVRRPLVYRDGASHGHVVGKSGPLQEMLTELSPDVDFDVTAVGEFPCPAEDRSTRLTDRQREVVQVALAMGYYERPRRITHEEIAAELDCGVSTVTEHLQKAEDKLIRSAIGDEIRHCGVRG
ncbi:helix-turn-helix domain-containing protein [Halovivax limisalsi]|uniref:helix-turn-helix domain-containing protein n=1 Tax=Halovivax limisalsi TaxID=1453760 RepID=UPI001FFCA6A6|nr:helix-turn-helix domain-containing protein [Halovivax limisalsi]